MTVRRAFVSPSRRTSFLLILSGHRTSRGLIRTTRTETDSPTAAVPGVVSTVVHWLAYWPEWVLLLASASAPAFVAAYYRDARPFARAGALTVFFAASAQSFSIGRAKIKHLHNARRAKNSQSPRDFSSTAKVISWLPFGCGLVGTIILAYGDLF